MKEVWFHYIDISGLMMQGEGGTWPSPDGHNLFHAQLTLKEFEFAQKKTGGGLSQTEEEKLLQEIYEFNRNVNDGHSTRSGFSGKSGGGSHR